jgi:integrase
MRAFKIRRNQKDYFRVDLPKDLFPDGKRRSATARTRREAIEKAQHLLQQRKKGLNTEEAKALLADFLQRFLVFYKTEGGVALRTWQDYRYHIDENVIPGIGAIPLVDLKPREVDLWMKSLRDHRLRPRTVEYSQAVLRRALQFAVEWEILDRNPAARFRAAERKRAANAAAKRIQFLNPDEARQFLDVVRGDCHEALYAFAVTTGLRPEELYGPRCKDVNLDARKLTVNQVLSHTRRKKGERFLFGPPKTDKSRRTIDFPEFVREVLQEERRCAIESRSLAGANGRTTRPYFRPKLEPRLKSATSCDAFKRFVKPDGGWRSSFMKSRG